MSRSQEDILEEMLNWLRFTGMQDAKELIYDMLTFEDDDRKHRDSRIAFELMDGQNSLAEIGRHITYSDVTVGNWREKWSKLGIVNENSETGHPEHLISLTDLGLDCPPIPDPDEDEEDVDSEESNDNSDE